MRKKLLKNIIASSCSSFNYPIIINSYGRSGSTVLTKSIINSSIKIQNRKSRELAYWAISNAAWDLEKNELKDGMVYKTHDYPPSRKLERNVRILYTFADPVDVVLSLLRLYDERGEEWMKQHYDHLKVPYNNFENIIEEDQLQLEKHLDRWLREKRFSIAFIKYEKMWAHQKDISQFLGFEIKLPPFRERRAMGKKNEELITKIEDSYKSLISKFQKMVDFSIHNSRN